MNKRFTMVVLGLCLTTFSGGCDSSTYLMPTPNIYTNPAWNPFAEVPASRQGDELAVLYVTDRAPEPREDDELLTYGDKRSRSLAFGEAVVQIGEGLAWDDVVRISRSKERDSKVELKVTAVRELARFGKSPPLLVLTDAEMSPDQRPDADPAQQEAEQRFREAIAAPLADSPDKDVFIFVHGFRNSFEDAMLVTSQWWHFLGREGVAVAYAWPAATGGLFAYEYTVASTQFTVHNLKTTLRLIASCPEVRRIHILAHSRGTAVTTETIRELHLETRNIPGARDALKLGTVILAAADVDLDVMIARNATERIGRAVDRTALYVSKEDKALGLANWLFGGAARVGKLDVKMFNPAELQALRGSRRLQLIDARVSTPDATKHNYFQNSPAVSSDILLLLRFQLNPGAEHGRPLEASEEGLWTIEEEYPGNNWKPPAALHQN